MKVKSNNLLIAAGFVWILAGVNVVAIGINALLSFSFWYAVGLLVAGLVIFILFGGMFHRVMAKNVRRIRELKDAHSNIFQFLDVRGYFVMAIMMILGFGLRLLGLAPGWFFAFFYTGLGAALCLSGIMFFIARYMSRDSIVAMHHGHRMREKHIMWHLH